MVFYEKGRSIVFSASFFLFSLFSYFCLCTAVFHPDVSLSAYLRFASTHHEYYMDKEQQGPLCFGRHLTVHILASSVYPQEELLLGSELGYTVPHI